MIQKISKNFIGTMSKFLTHKASEKLYETKIQIFQLTTISKNCDSTVSLSSSLSLCLSSSLSLCVTNGKIFQKTPIISAIINTLFKTK